MKTEQIAVDSAFNGMNVMLKLKSAYCKHHSKVRPYVRMYRTYVIRKK